ncbi:fimbrial biogenesis outer membrane usher protein [Pseudomonas aeruginosa]|uniref:fimbria/pilus outer membrane usher protein n=1 Tax=Pseudomonas aeruginosa TaxID=287 RepID=UPI0018DFBD12|nr:fimbria/pilus outer membrane usher protein [Pseudomonas aeruginosa]MBI7027291.1 fimbrial biogenesis outer membrane usher protein [Pseudomonas aeruginosa]MBI9169540.1 fimbrial biogenesis outer membrane usher protein [Pseudomonas aeruginosa]MCY0314816.1 fimbrial biogenesis outer membrane usher protein [Pseudomonas aeruginosa]MCY0516848.1 fimbrial biogenesis outer membrane usher protein [Pseudomonas aeruginosa]QPZ72714.1 fimbrial biogenesis outer membrane usher protein [Pseudomonas aeruginosa]
MSEKTDFVRRTGAPLIALAGWVWPLPLYAAADPDPVEFNAAFLRSPVDVRMFAEGNPVAPGRYRIDLYTNGHWKGRTEVRFELPDSASRIARPCYDRKLVDTLGLDLAQIAETTRQALVRDGLCADLEQILPQSSATFDSAMQRLDVIAPQAMLARSARGYVSPEFWDEGVTAGTLQYDYNAYHSELSSSQSFTSQFLGLRAGLNLGPWRLRYRSTATWSSQDTLRYRNSAVYAERALADWRSNLTLGEASTNGQVFDSISFRGVQLASDDRMYADSQRGFAPVVRGIANSNARVRVSQRGNQIYETTVPPGPFVIDDLYPNGSGGDLLVTVTEANGSEHSFTVTYASTAELLRPGVTHYSLAAGQYRSGLMHDEPMLALGTWRHGFSNMMTGYGGGIVAEGYAAIAGGMAFNTDFGALAADVTHSRTDDDAGHIYSGQSLRLSYAKILPVLDTNVTLASYRYSSSGYYDPADAFLLRDHSWSGVPIERRRNRFVVNATQALPNGYGSFAVSGSTQDYWAREGSDTEYVLSYNNQFGRFSVGASAARTRNLTTGDWDNQFMLSLSVPLGESRRSPQLSTTYTHESDSQSLQGALAGNVGSDNQYRYNAFASLNDSSEGGTHKTAGFSGTWAAPYASVGANASSGHGYRQYGASASGGIVAYRSGVVLSPLLGDTIGIVEADQAHGARVSNYSGVRVDGDGLAVVPYLNPYRRNSVEIDPKGISTDVQLHSTSQHIAPTAGAVVLMRFETETGYSMLLSGRLSNGEPLPFAAGVFDAGGRNVGYIAQGGQAILRVSDLAGSLLVRWGDEARQRCAIDYAFDPHVAADELGYRPLQARCVPLE